MSLHIWSHEHLKCGCVIPGVLLRWGSKAPASPSGIIETETLKIDHRIANFSLDFLRLRTRHILPLTHRKNKILPSVEKGTLIIHAESLLENTNKMKQYFSFKHLFKMTFEFTAYTVKSIQFAILEICLCIH